MKIKLDENLPVRLSQALSQLGHDVDTAMEEGLIGKDDSVIWEAAQEHQRLLITQDLDFSDLRQYQPGSHAGIVLVRLRDPSGAALFERVTRIFEEGRPEEWCGAFIVATDHKLRIRSPRT